MSSPDRTIDLSFPQIVGGSVGAATAAALSTRLDLVGTIVGAAFASVIAAVVTAAITGWLRRASALALHREPTRVRSVVVGALALGLVAVALAAGVDLLTADLPRDAFVARWLAEVGLTPT